jgi:RNA polymerase sigma factor (sigma-70 family)
VGLLCIVRSRGRLRQRRGVDESQRERCKVRALCTSIPCEDVHTPAMTVRSASGPKTRDRDVDRDLVVRAQAGDRAAFARLVDLEWERLRRIAFRILRDPYSADDATQQALLGVWRDLPRLRDPERYEAWVHRLLVRRCYQESKQAKRSTAAGLRDTRADPALDGGLGVIADRDELERGFARLKIEQRTVLVLHYYQGLALTEIAAAMEVPTGTIYSRLHRALKDLRGFLEADARSVDQHGATREAAR